MPYHLTTTPHTHLSAHPSQYAVIPNSTHLPTYSEEMSVEEQQAATALFNLGFTHKEIETYLETGELPLPDFSEKESKTTLETFGTTFYNGFQSCMSFLTGLQSYLPSLPNLPIGLPGAEAAKPKKERTFSETERNAVLSISKKELSNLLEGRITVVNGDKSQHPKMIKQTKEILEKLRLEGSLSQADLALYLKYHPNPQLYIYASYTKFSSGDEAFYLYETNELQKEGMHFKYDAPITDTAHEFGHAGDVTRKKQMGIKSPTPNLSYPTNPKDRKLVIKLLNKCRKELNTLSARMYNYITFGEPVDPQTFKLIFAPIQTHYSRNVGLRKTASDFVEFFSHLAIGDIIDMNPILGTKQAGKIQITSYNDGSIIFNFLDPVARFYYKYLNTVDSLTKYESDPSEYSKYLKEFLPPRLMAAFCPELDTFEQEQNQEIAETILAKGIKPNTSLRQASTEEAIQQPQNNKPGRGEL